MFWRCQWCFPYWRTILDVILTKRFTMSENPAVRRKTHAIDVQLNLWFPSISIVGTRQSLLNLQLRRPTDVERCKSIYEIERQEVHWGFMYSDASFNDELAPVLNWREMMCAVMIWLSLLHKKCVLSFRGRTFAVKWPMVRRNSYHRLALIGLLLLTSIDLLRVEAQIRR